MNLAIRVVMGMAFGCAVGLSGIVQTQTANADHPTQGEARRLYRAHPEGSGPMFYSSCSDDPAVRLIWAWGPDSWAASSMGAISVGETGGICIGDSYVTLVTLWEYGQLSCASTSWACFVFLAGDPNYQHNVSGTHWHVHRTFVIWDYGKYPEFASDDYRRYAASHEFGHGMNLGHHGDTKCDGELDWVMAEYVPPSGNICITGPNATEMCSAWVEYNYQADLDGDLLVDGCDTDADGDHCLNVIELSNQGVKEPDNPLDRKDFPDFVVPSNKVDFADFNYFAAHYGTNDPLADLNGSGYVDWADYQIFSAGYGRTCL